jgi:hypothetical protein
MVKIKYAIIATVVLIAGIWTFMHFYQSDEKKVRKLFDQLSEWASKEQNEDHFTMAGKIKNIGELCADDFVLTTHKSSTSREYSPKEISGLAAHFRFPFTMLTVEFKDIQIEFTEKRRAKAITTVVFSGNMKGGENVDDTFEVGCDLIKLDSKWLFTAAEVIEVLEK